jgi:transglutaminase-like putative cysteine protease
LHAFAMMLFGSLLFSVPALADPAQIRTAPDPAWAVASDPLPVPTDASGLVFVRRQDVIIHLDANGQQQYNSYRFKILNSNALQAGNISLVWNPAAGTPLVHAITVWRGAERIDVLKTTQFEILRREDQLEAARLDGVLTAVLRVPDLRIGDELEVAYTIPASDPTLRHNDAGALLLGPAPGPGRYRLELNWAKGYEPRQKMTPDMAAAVMRREGAVQFRFDNPPMLTPPKDAPPRYQVQRLVEFSSFDDWAGVSRQFAQLFATAAKLDPRSAVKVEAARIAASNATPLERASAALRLVQQDVRYIYVGLDRGNLTPATADETWQRRYGDCKGKTALLLALLGELGIRAEAVLVNTVEDDGLDLRLPNPRIFDHVFVRAWVDGKALWLDGTLPSVVPPSAEPVFSLRWVLPVSAAGSALERIDWRPQRQPDEINLLDIDARAGFDVPAKVTAITILRRVKGLQQQLQFSPVSSNQLSAALRQQLVGPLWQSIDTVKWHFDEKAQASVLTIIGTWTIDWSNDGGAARSYALPGGGFSPPDRRARSADQNQQVPFYRKPEYQCSVTTLRVPAQTRLERWSTKDGFDTVLFGTHYYRGLERRDGAIRIIRGLRVEHPEVEAESARKDNGRVATFDNSMAWASYDPASSAPLAKPTTGIPATDEMDWTADNVPCLGGAASGASR